MPEIDKGDLVEFISLEEFEPPIEVEILLLNRFYVFFSFWRKFKLTLLNSVLYIVYNAVSTMKLV